MTREEAKDVFLNRGFVKVNGGEIFDGDKWRQSVVVISNWLEQESCEDVIGRQDAIDVARKWFDKIQLNGDICLDGIRSLPSVAPQQKVGRWIRVDKDKLKCSECEVIHYIAQYPQSANINYCPNCGCRMKGEKE